MKIYGISEGFYDMEYEQHRRLQHKFFRKKADAEAKVEALNNELDEYDRMDMPYEVCECEVVW